MGRRIASRLGESGRLAGNSFSSDFSSAVQGRFRRIQSNLADILSDEDSFRQFASGFDTVGDAVDRLNTDLETLRDQKYIDDEGNERLVLTAQQLRDFGAEARRLGRTLEAQNKIEQDLAATQNRLRVETDDLERAWARLGSAVGDGDAFRQVADRVGGTEEAFERLRAEIEDGGTAMRKSGIEIDSLVDKLERTRDAVERDNDSLARMEHHFVRLEAAVDGLGRKITHPWRMLDNDVRLVIMLIGAAADQIAALGSASGAGIISLGGAFSSLGIGIGSAIPVFLRLNEELEALPESMRPVAREFQSFKGSFTDLADAIAGAAFEELDGTFVSLGDSVRALEPAFATVGRVIGRLGRDFAKNLEPGSENLENIAILVEDSGPLFDSLARSAGKLGGALVRGFNEALPLTEQFVGWIDTLITRFDDFTQSQGFDDWIRNAQLIWTDFGELLDATGRALNDLATPSSVANLRSFMDDLTGFMPNLAEFLNVLGELNVLGILANALNEFGSALEPLSGPTLELAGALSEVAFIITDELADALGALAGAAAPVVQALANIIDAVPDDAWAGIANGALVLAGAFVIFRGAKGIAGAAGLIGDFTKKLDAMGVPGQKAVGLLGGLAKGAGALAAFSIATAILDDWLGSLQDTNVELARLVGVSDSAADALASVTQGLDVKWWGEVATDVTSVQMALDSATASSTDFGAALSQSLGQKATLDALSQYGKALEQMATNDLPAAQQAFQNLVTQYDLTRQQQSQLLEQMPGYRDLITGVAEATTGQAGQQALLNAAQGIGIYNTQEQTRTLEELEGKSGEAGGAIDGLAEKIRNFGSATLDSREAERQFQEAVDAVTASVEANGNSLDIGTEKGRANEAALDDIAESALDLAAATYERTSSEDEAAAAVQAGRDELIKQLAQFGITGQAAEDYADDLGLIPEDIDTLVQLLGTQAAENALNNVARDRTANIRVNVSGQATGSYNLGPREALASGRMVYGPTSALIGEAGPEAVVPLNRPLSQVDPSVRELAAFAQGKLRMASGGIAGAGGGNVFDIDVWEAEDGRRTANDVVERIIENVTG